MAPVLVTDGGRGASRSALATVRALASAGHRVTLTTNAGRELASASRAVASTVDVPAARDAEAFAEAISALETELGPIVTFCTSDDALLALRRPEARFVDKDVLPKLAANAGLPMPESTLLERAADIDRIEQWPVVMKPRTGAAPAVHVRSPAEAQRVDVGDGAIVQQWLEGPMTAISGVMWGGALRAVVHQRYLRRWPRDCGTASAAETTAPDRTLEAGLVRMLHDHDGVFQAQFIDGKLIDVNPRPYGSMSLAVQAGVNPPALVCELAGGGDIGELVRGREGVRYRWLEGDLRHLVAATVDREVSLAEAVAAIRPRRGTAHSVFAATDPAPTIGRFADVVRTSIGRQR